ncbi:MAG: MFS transporter [Chloroflexota bacterium]
MKKIPFHYAWVVLVSGMTISALSSGIRGSFGVLVDPLVKQYGWSVGAISLAYSLEFLSAVGVALVAGIAADKVGARKVLVVTVVAFTSGLLLTGTVTELWQLYVYFGLLAGGLGIMGNVVVPVIVTRWFARRVGLALGVMWASLGAGGAVAAPLLSWLIARVGWRQGFFIVGVAAGGLMLLAAYFTRGRPQDMHMEAYGEEAGASAQAQTAAASPPLSFGFVRRTPAFWHLVNIHFLGCVGHSVFLAQIVYMAIQRGISPLTAAGLLSAITGFSIFSRFVTPILAERIGGKGTLTIAFLLQSVPILLLFWTHQTWQFYLFAAVFGIGFGAEMPAFPIINKQYYGTRAPLTTIYSWQLAGALSGMALGGGLGGALYDWTGAYTWSITVGFLFNIVGLVPILLLPRHQPGRVILAPVPSAGGMP